MDESLVYRSTTSNRLLIADFLDGLTDEQWAVPTLCPGWTVHHMAAHLLQPMLIGFGRFLLTSIVYRGDTDRVVDHVTRRLARQSRSQIIDRLRRHAGDRVSPPRVGPMGPFAETCLHLRDIARPLGADVDVPTSSWELLLDYLVSADVAPALVPPRRLDSLYLEATDSVRAWGRGCTVRGPVEALAMAATGRRDAFAQLTGPGIQPLQTRLSMGADR